MTTRYVKLQGDFNPKTHAINKRKPASWLEVAVFLGAVILVANLLAPLIP